MKTELLLPIELHKLGLEEIGTIFVLMSSPYMNDILRRYWESQYIFRKTVASLTEEGIIMVDDKGELQIDLTWV
jgi:hypothetical protein